MRQRLSVYWISGLAWFLFCMTGCQKQNPREDIAKKYSAEVTAFASEGGPGLPYFVGEDLRPVWKTENQPQPRILKSFQLTDQKGKLRKSDELHGKVSIVSFFFTECPGICPMVTENLKAFQGRYKNDDRFAMVSLSISPDRDTPTKLKRFAQKYQIDYNRWKLLTGKRDEIYRVARESFNADTFSERENELIKLRPQDFLHSENIYLLDSQQRLRGIYQGRSVSSVAELIRDAEQLIQ